MLGVIAGIMEKNMETTIEGLGLGFRILWTVCGELSDFARFAQTVQLASANANASHSFGSCSGRLAFKVA